MTALRDLPLAAAAAALLSLSASAQTVCSQSLDPTPEPGAGLTCTNVGVDVGNRYMRRYDALADCTVCPAGTFNACRAFQMPPMLPLAVDIL